MSEAPLPFLDKNVVVAVTDRDYPKAKPPHGGPIIRALESLGCRAVRVPDGDPRGLECDLLILYGNCRAFRAYPRLLKRSKNRPPVAMWQIDPLPPPSLDARFEAFALRYSDLFAHRRILRPIELMAGLPLYYAISRRGLGAYSDRRRGNYTDLAMARTCVETYASIRRGMAEGWLSRVFPATTNRQIFLAERGVDTRAISFGYYDGVGDDRQRDRDIDVLFIGSLKERHRRHRLNRILGEIAKAGARVEVVTRGMYGDRRIELLNRTKIVIHIHKYPWDTPWMRWVMSVANGAAVLSEPLSDPAPFVPGVHYFEASAEEMPATVARLLADPELVRLTATRCREFVRERFTLQQSMEVILSGFFAPLPPAP